ncbi:NupC/NupG family nucleoside CNT transporter [Thermoflavimicrobium daqui]|jgi:CNT family concentrative nucleoside transporter|uniref:Nucleoside permease n=1 Tax=Thermoflavimicrobium daqui TaxID=2137476 RepID=A0A364K7J4_9BACL|nr:NupC/NupG family nucleoside CNT transporter [Thermoflavimicrobium daqui]RAL26248.1 NupC/NupG family nucleoside CNT transporter [Thermoflavimicrobium daqui]
MKILWGLVGIAFLFLISFLLSNNKKEIRLRTVVIGFLIQFLFALIVLKWSLGQAALKWLSLKVQALINFANAGIQFLFGGLIQPNKPPIFALQVLPVIIFLGALIGVLYYFGIIQWIVRVFGGAIAKLMKTSRVESLSAIATVFLGQSEAPLLIRLYLDKLTSSELFAIMTSGFTSVAGSTLISYALIGVPLPYLLTASIMAAPASLTIAKIIFPEDRNTESAKEVSIDKSQSVNLIDAIASGALDGLKLAINVGGLLLAFISLIALFNGILGGIGGWFGVTGITLEKILGYILSPVAFIIGVPWSEAIAAGGFIGQKLVLNEFVAYTSFAPEIPHLSAKTVAIVTFALCGFANLGSIAIQIGTIGGLAPERSSDVARLGLKALLAGTIANLMNATIAGMLIG